MYQVNSKDGTIIAFQQTGKGPLIIIVASALADRSDTAKLANLLSHNFTVINYDRRGRGKSGDASLYSIKCEIEDIEALIDQAGESAYLFGSSSGAVLALDAANELTSKVKKVALYEAPLIIDRSKKPTPKDLYERISKKIKEDKRSEAVKLFMAEGMGIPAIGVFLMRFFPGWSKMRIMAHTILYDLAILKGIQDGRRLPEDRWSSIEVPVFIMTGQKSEEFFHAGAKQLASMLINANFKKLKGQHHGSVMMSPKFIALKLEEFFASK